ncbi:hypothetical protein MMC11_005556 [Xylographa trunciseda]|nr:hypothetical protein [Xylographa trunciseda]
MYMTAAIAIAILTFTAGLQAQPLGYDDTALVARNAQPGAAAYSDAGLEARMNLHAGDMAKGALGGLAVNAAANHFGHGISNQNAALIGAGVNTALHSQHVSDALHHLIQRDAEAEAEADADLEARMNLHAMDAVKGAAAGLVANAAASHYGHGTSNHLSDAAHRLVQRDAYADAELEARMNLHAMDAVKGAAAGLAANAAASHYGHGTSNVNAALMGAGANIALHSDHVQYAGHRLSEAAHSLVQRDADAYADAEAYMYQLELERRGTVRNAVKGGAAGYIGNQAAGHPMSNTHAVLAGAAGNVALHSAHLSKLMNNPALGSLSPQQQQDQQAIAAPMRRRSAIAEAYADAHAEEMELEARGKITDGAIGAVLGVGANMATGHQISHTKAAIGGALAGVATGAVLRGSKVEDEPMGAREKYGCRQDQKVQRIKDAAGSVVGHKCVEPHAHKRNIVIDRIIARRAMADAYDSGLYGDYY